MKHQNFRGQPFEHYCRKYKDFTNMYKYLLEKDEVLRIKHEDLIYDPESVMNRVFEFIGIRPSKKPIRYLASTLISSQSDPRTKKKNVKEEFKQREPVYNEWTEEQRKLFKEICADAMKTLGYEVPY